MNVDFYFVEQDGKVGAECSKCGARFFDSKGRKGNDCVPEVLRSRATGASGDGRRPHGEGGAAA
jgi:hypothetical protein